MTLCPTSIRMMGAPARGSKNTTGEFRGPMTLALFTDINPILEEVLLAHSVGRARPIFARPADEARRGESSIDHRSSSIDHHSSIVDHRSIDRRANRH